MAHAISASEKALYAQYFVEIVAGQLRDYTEITQEK